MDHTHDWDGLSSSHHAAAGVKAMQVQNNRNDVKSALRGQYALITGASEGLGRAFAEECAYLGMNLLLVALPASGLSQVAQDVARRYGVQAEPLEMDLTVPDRLADLVPWIADHGLPVSVLINNAGVGYNCRFEDSSLRQNESCILLNNLALVKLTHLILPELKRQQRAFILNVSSMAAFFPMPYMPVYGPSKAFILNFSLALRAEMRGTPVRVSVLCPNGIRTNPECRQKIDAHGLIGQLVSMDPQPVARCAMRELLEGKPVIVLGWANRLLVGLGQHVPPSLASAIVSAFYGKTARPATGVATRPRPAYRLGGWRWNAR
jgi:short-subunit dehydrogenase